MPMNEGAQKAEPFCCVRERPCEILKQHISAASCPLGSMPPQAWLTAPATALCVGSSVRFKVAGVRIPLRSLDHWSATPCLHHCRHQQKSKHGHLHEPVRETKMSIASSIPICSALHWSHEALFLQKRLTDHLLSTLLIPLYKIAGRLQLCYCSLQGHNGCSPGLMCAGRHAALPWRHE